jgi:hypothetical protein
MSALGPTCVNTRASRECAELFSTFSFFDCDCCSFPIQRNQDKISTRKFDVGVFTQAGSFSTKFGYPCDVRFPPDSDQTADLARSPKGAKPGSRTYAQIDGESLSKAARKGLIVTRPARATVQSCRRARQRRYVRGHFSRLLVVRER